MTGARKPSCKCCLNPKNASVQKTLRFFQHKKFLQTHFVSAAMRQSTRSIRRDIAQIAGSVTCPLIRAEVYNKLLSAPDSCGYDVRQPSSYRQVIFLCSVQNTASVCLPDFLFSCLTKQITAFSITFFRESSSLRHTLWLFDHDTPGLALMKEPC